MAAAPTPGSTPGSLDGIRPAPHPVRPARLRPRVRGDRLVRHGARAAAPALPHRPARRDGRPRGPGRLPAQGVGRHPQPGRRPDQRPLDQPRRAPPAVPHPLRHSAGTRVRAALHRPDLPDRPGHHLGGRAVHRLRHRLRVLPGALRRDARRDDRRLRRAHPADDLAGGDPRPHHPRQRRSVAGHPQPARPGVGLPRGRACSSARSSSSARSAPGGAPATRR